MKLSKDKDQKKILEDIAKEERSHIVKSGDAAKGTLPSGLGSSAEGLVRTGRVDSLFRQQ